MDADEAEEPAALTGAHRRQRSSGMYTRAPPAQRVRTYMALPAATTEPALLQPLPQPPQPIFPDTAGEILAEGPDVATSASVPLMPDQFCVPPDQDDAPLEPQAMPSPPPSPLSLLSPPLLDTLGEQVASTDQQPLLATLGEQDQATGTDQQPLLYTPPLGSTQQPLGQAQSPLDATQSPYSLFNYPFNDA